MVEDSIQDKKDNYATYLHSCCFLTDGFDSRVLHLAVIETGTCCMRLNMLHSRAACAL
jgi:hypothetical protein